MLFGGRSGVRTGRAVPDRGRFCARRT